MTKRTPKTTTPDGGMRIRRNDTAFIVQIKGGALADLLREAAEAARDASRPISDVRASAEYRRMLVETLVERAVVRAAERALSGRDAQ